MAEDGVGLHVLDITTHSKPSLIGIIDAFNGSGDVNSSVYAVDLALSSDDNTAFVANLDGGLQIFDVHSHTSDLKLSGELMITSVDLFGNTSSELSIIPLFDLTPPDPPILSSEFSNPIVLNSSARASGFNLDGSAEPLSQVLIRLGYNTWTVNVDNLGHWDFVLPASAVPLDSNTYQFEFSVVDSADNHSDA